MARQYTVFNKATMRINIDATGPSHLYNDRRRERRLRLCATVTNRAMITAPASSIFFLAGPPGLHELLLLARGNGIVVAQIHGVAALAAREGLEA